MIAVDTNILIYFLVSSQPEHLRAKKWFEANKDPLATTNTNIAEALRLLTHPRVFPQPLSLENALQLFNIFIEEFAVTVLSDAENWWNWMLDLLGSIRSIRGNAVFDAQIACCLQYHGVKKICTLDDDFTKYRFLKIVKI